MKEKIELQVSQAAFKTSEAYRTYKMAVKNLEKADENLRNAQLGFQEGVLTTTNVLEAQTAWLEAQSEKIDAEGFGHYEILKIENIKNSKTDLQWKI